MRNINYEIGYDEIFAYVEIIIILFMTDFKSYLMMEWLFS